MFIALFNSMYKGYSEKVSLISSEFLIITLIHGAKINQKMSHPSESPSKKSIDLSCTLPNTDGRAMQRSLLFELSEGQSRKTVNNNRAEQIIVDSVLYFPQRYNIRN